MPNYQNDLHRVGAAIKYNPHLWSAEELRSIFIARKNELQQILDIITQTEVSDAPQHTLITGQRGMGKSTLLQRVALAIEEDEGLSKVWLPLRFPEEQYTVTTLAELWTNVLNSLADTLEEQPEKQREIDDFLETLEKTKKDKREKMAVSYLEAWCEKNQLRLLLLMDSTDLLLSNLSHSGKKKKADAGAPQLWRLRDTLQNSPCFFWLGGSYQPVDADAMYHDTFLDFFYNVELRPLSIKEMRDVMRELAETFGVGRDLTGKEAVKEIDRIFDEYPARLKVLRRLSGGNLRTTVMLYELLSAGGEDNVQSDLKRLLDLMTPLYKSRMETLADQPRKILAHLFEHWAPISLGELANISGLEKTSLSPQLQRLELEGLIEKTQLPNTSRKGYQITERFFNIWYLMRNAPRRLRLRLNYLISFMKLWFNTEELSNLALRQNNKHTNGESVSLNDCEFSRALAYALPEQSTLKHQLEWNVFKQSRRDFKEQLNDLFDLQGEDKPFATSDAYIKRLEALPEKLKKLSFKITKKELESWIDNILSSPSLSLANKEELADNTPELTKTQFDNMQMGSTHETKIFTDLSSQEAYKQIRQAIRKGDLFPDFPDSEIAYTQLITCFSKDPAAFKLALYLFLNQSHDKYVEKAYQKAITLDPDDVDLRIGLGNLLQNHLKCYEDAEQAYQEAIALDPENSITWNNLGGLLQSHLKHYELAEQAYQKAITLDPKDAIPWSNLGLLQNHLKRYEEAEQAYQTAIALDPENATPWSNLGHLLQDYLKHYEDAEQAYQTAITLVPEDATPWIGLGNLLQNHLKRYEEAEQAYQTAITLDPKVATPWIGLGNLFQNHLKRYEEAEQAYQTAIALVPENATSWIGLGNLLQNHLKRYEEAEQAYQTAITLDPKDATPWIGLGNLFQDHLKYYSEAEKVLRQVLMLNKSSPYGYANLARCLSVSNQAKESEIKKNYRMAIEKSENHFELLLQAHLYLGNQDLALQALEHLAKEAEKGDTYAFYRIKEQCYECYAIGLGSKLADLMQNSAYASFLQSFILALKAVDGDEQALLAVPVEVAEMAKEVMLEIQK